MNSGTQSINEETTRSPATEKADLKLEVVVIPVSDVERAKAFYSDKVGFHVDHDLKIGEGKLIVQLTPPGS